MPRHSRIVIPDVAYHITQRGNYRQKVFYKKEDYLQYCDWLNEYAKKYHLELLAYCLMPNHIHVIATPSTEESLARTFNTVHMRYAQHHNRKHRLYGHLWQGRFYSCILDDAHLYRAIRYVERNPVRAKMVQRAWEYPYSSARIHVGEEENPAILLSHRDQTMNEKEWREYLHDEDEAFNSEIRLKTLRGLVVGAKDFVQKLERRLERSLACLNPGRPRKGRK